MSFPTVSIPLAWRPFLEPMPIYAYWFWLLIPLCLGFSVVYKAVKCSTMAQVPRAAISITFWILLVMGLAAGALTAVVKLLS